VARPRALGDPHEQRDPPQRDDQHVKREQVERVVAKVQPLLGAVELSYAAERPERVRLRDAEHEDLRELDDVLDHVAVLDQDDRGHEAERTSGRSARLSSWWRGHPFRRPVRDLAGHRDETEPKWTARPVATGLRRG